MLADPTLDDRGDHLGGLHHVDAASSVARQDEWTFRGDAEPAIRQPDHANADDGALELSCEAGDRWIGFAAPTKKGDVHAAREMLVHQHAEMLAAIERG